MSPLQPVSGALAELQAGAAGDEFTALLRRTIRAVGISRNFPAPDSHGTWDADAVWSTASEFLSDRQTPRRLADLALHCASEQALRARLQGTVRNFLADLGRRTPIGKLVVRINDVLGGEPDFVRVDGRWARRVGPTEAGNDDHEALGRAIQGHAVTVPTWGHDASRAAPVADRSTIVAVCAILLEAAGGSLTPRSLARVIGHRLGLGQAPLSMDVDAFDAPASGAAPAHDETGAHGLRFLRATEIVALLNDRERLAVAHPEYTVRELAPLAGTSPSQAHLIRRRATTVIGAELLDDDDAEGVALLVMELARRWAGAVDTDARSAVLVRR